MNFAWRPTPILCALVVSAGALMFAAGLPNVRYSPDSWSYWELSQTFHTEFYRFNTWRSYAADIPYSASFPPLWPAVNAGMALLGVGPVTLVLTNALVLALFAAGAAWAGRSAFGSAAAGLAAVMVTVGDRTWLDEVLSGRSIPLQMALLSGALGALASAWRPGWRFGVAGLLCGLMLANRFDAAPFLVALAVLLLGAPDRRWWPVFLLAAFVPVLPWIGYSLLRFGTVFATDNRLVTLSTDPAAFVTDFRPSWVPGLRDDPQAWLAKVWGNVPGLLGGLLLHWSPLQGVVLAGGLAAVPIRRARGIRLPRRSVFAIAAILLALCAVLPTVLATGYADGRYFAPLRWLLVFVSLGLLHGALQRPRPWGSVVLVAVGLVAMAQRGVASAGTALGFHPPPAFTQTDAYRPWLACLGAHETLLFLDSDTEAARFGALTGHGAAMRPRNLDRLTAAEQQLFLQRFHIGAVVWQTAAGEAMATTLGAQPIPGCPGLGRVMGAA